MTFGELYRRSGEWKFRAVGQGFNGGLAPLARSFGIDVADEPAPRRLRPRRRRPPPPPPPPPPPRRRARRRRAPSASPRSAWRRRASRSASRSAATSFGEIVINLNWTRGKKGFFGGGTRSISISAACSRWRPARRASSRRSAGCSATITSRPSSQLDGDDRTGDVSQGRDDADQRRPLERDRARRDLRQHL